MSIDPRYPIGRFERTAFDPGAVPTLIDQLQSLPRALASAVEGLSDGQLDTPYREGGWTVRQTVHHIADSHINSYVRFRLALTEERPTIRTYDEGAWAELADARSHPVEPSISLVRGLHDRWVALLGSLTEGDWQRVLVHPERGEMTLGQMLLLYAWHGRHHVAHITSLRERSGW